MGLKDTPSKYKLNSPPHNIILYFWTSTEALLAIIYFFLIVRLAAVRYFY